MRISFDLDDMLICRKGTVPSEPNRVPWLLRGLLGEPLRLGFRRLAAELERRGWEVCIYTTSFRPPWRVRVWLRWYGIRPAPTPALPFDRSGARVDTAFWVEWCATHRSGALRERLQSARSAADEEVERLLREFMEEVAEEERVVGLSEVLCAWAGCTSRTPAGRRICVAHSRKAALTARLEEPYWEIRRALNIGPIDSPLIHRTR